MNQLRMLAERLKITLGKKTTGNVGPRWEECSPGALKAFLVVCVMCYSGNAGNSAPRRLSAAYPGGVARRESSPY